ncbi:hypothetical protein [Rheinheimera sp. UJ63]|uniref:hypothetical protein n=1 Tax=Rheinheimera sp. UJ63 TaxID=2910157 RepID=UPI001F2F10F5|nr:hypothetical protein [Rheinheimera sp. UJ63]MCF4009135.1 hypothetical protein [Rheinheimera sp. UJ63]
MSQQRPKGGKAADPLQKPWMKNAKSAANKAKRPVAASKPLTAKPMKTVLDNEG